MMTTSDMSTVNEETHGKFDIPVVLFAFKRLSTVKLIMERIREISPSKFYVFIDGPRKEVNGEADKVKGVRDYLTSEINWSCDKKIFYWETNKGCDKNITEGLNLVFSEQEMAIVFEDDAVPTLDFFRYCQELLRAYRNDKKIQFIAGFNAVGEMNVIADDYSFAKTPPMSGAFATWADRWNNCDFQLKQWKVLQDKRFINEVYFSREMRKRCVTEFNEFSDGIITAWDVMFNCDMLMRDRLAIVPKRNLATSYGYMEGAFHPQGRREGKKLLKIMSQYNEPLVFPLRKPESITRNSIYDMERQRLMLSVKGNYVERHLRYMYLAVKNCIYKSVPSDVWNTFRHVIKRK